MSGGDGPGAGRGLVDRDYPWRRGMGSWENCRWGVGAVAGEVRRVRILRIGKTSGVCDGCWVGGWVAGKGWGRVWWVGVFWLQVGGWLFGLGVGVRFRMVLGRGVAIRIVGEERRVGVESGIWG